MRNLNFELKQLCERNRDGSYAAQADRHTMLQQMAKTLHDLGYRNMHAVSLKPKHVEALIISYKDAELSTGTIKNRLSVIRWWAEKTHKENVVARDNAYYGIESRIFVTDHSKATELDQQKLDSISNAHIQTSLLVAEIIEKSKGELNRSIVE